jgi:hypothetical protein
MPVEYLVRLGNVDAAEREYLRRAVDAAARARLVGEPRRSCAGCGGPLDSYAAGCEVCAARRRRRFLRRRRLLLRQTTTAD